MLQKHNKNCFGPTNGTMMKFQEKRIDGRTYESEKGIRRRNVAFYGREAHRAERQWRWGFENGRENCNIARSSASKWDRAKPKTKKLFYAVAALRNQKLFVLIKPCSMISFLFNRKIRYFIGFRAPRGAFQNISELSISRRNDQNQHCVPLRNLFIYQARENEFSGTT